MFIPQSRVLERLADCRINGLPDRDTEKFYNNGNILEDVQENKYNQRERMNMVVNDLTVVPDTLTNVNMAPTQQEYIDKMTDKLSNSNFNNIANEKFDTININDIDENYNVETPQKQIENVSPQYTQETVSNNNQFIPSNQFNKENIVPHYLPRAQPQIYRENNEYIKINRKSFWTSIIIIVCIVLLLFFVMIFKNLSDMKNKINDVQIYLNDLPRRI